MARDNLIQMIVVQPEKSGTSEETRDHQIQGNGGGSGIRTRDTVARIHALQACAFNHSATPPCPFFRGAAEGSERPPDAQCGAARMDELSLINERPVGPARASGL